MNMKRIIAILLLCSLMLCICSCAYLDVLFSNADEEIQEKGNEEKEATGIKNLRVAYNRVFGYFIEVTNSQKELVPDRYIRKQTLTNAERYMTEEFSRTERLIGAVAMERLKNARVAVFGVGGVGGHLCEALARAGVGAITVVDGDDVAPSNINRQIIALSSTVGRPKVEVIKERIALINPDCKVVEHRLFYLPETADTIDLSKYDYVVDAIDTVSGKIAIIESI